MTTSKQLQLRFLTRNNSNVCALPNKLIDSWNLHNKHEISISFGHRTVKAILKKHYGNEDQLWMTRELSDKLSIPYAHRLWVKVQGNTISLGPLVGIVTCDAITATGFPFTQKYNTYFNNLLKVQHSQKHAGVYFVFDVNAVNWDTLTVDGVILRPDTGGWERTKVPFPDVVYNKILSRTRENRPEAQRFIDQLNTKTRAQMFNEKYFQKWDVYERLSSIPAVSHLVPETYFNPSTEQINDMIRKYQMVYFKPVDGFMGLGIYQIKSTWNRIISRFRQKNKNVAKSYGSINEFLKQQLPLRKRKNYVIQQGIELAKKDGQPLDFRVHLNKNIHNKWEITGIGAKVAGKGSITTHVKAGGKIISPITALEEIFAGRAERLLEQLKENSIKIAEALEDSFNKPIGELGIDMGIDQSGQIWMFEANSKPGRSIFVKIDSLRPNAMYSNKLLLDYSTHLANFT